MPKKRRTKVVASAAKTVSGDESGNSSNEERQQKIETYLKDFDMKVANVIAQARSEAKTMCNAINSAFTMELFKLPKSIREMTKADFMARGGSINNNALQHITEITDSLASSITTQTLMPASKKRKVTPSSVESSASEAQSGVGEITSKTATTAKKKGAKGRKKTTTATTSKRSTRTQSVLTANQNMNMQDNAEPQTVRRSTRRKTTRNQFVTPATKTGKSGALSSGWDTPMVTPKFDPRLPVTPATCVMREAKRAETIISLSGSPIIMPPKRDLSKPEVVIPLADGTALTVGTSSPQVDLTMDETARRNILLLQSNLAKILKRCPVQGES
ncbi:borealin-like [Patiria miniata]|uniref:Borealin n=1 Tax=Patiria miniata TaxID=46514 RepID=A0A914BMC0_PATMI|nr:borealin-like [Patiria miniata]XP_038077264.1 borealin-like [Patiria miniata]XP_038077272.1 borealin-like [Patiria miniata]